MQILKNQNSLHVCIATEKNISNWYFTQEFKKNTFYQIYVHEFLLLFFLFSLECFLPDPILYSIFKPNLQIMEKITDRSELQSQYFWIVRFEFLFINSRGAMRLAARNPVYFLVRVRFIRPIACLIDF
jgi:hypothetical protein